MTPDAPLDLFDQQAAWLERPTGAEFGALPGAPAVLLLLDADARPVQLATTQNLRRFCEFRLVRAPDDGARRADLGAVVRLLRWRRVSSPFEARWYYYLAARVLHPRTYRKLVSFGPAWFLARAESVAPEIQITSRVFETAGEYVGPWMTERQARADLEALWDVFDLCRYPEQLRRAPRGERCAYAEMGRCDAPCDGSVALAVYGARVAAAWAFARGDRAGLAPLEAEMRAAAADLKFERAGVLKARLAAAARWEAEVCHRVADAAALDGLILVPVTRRRAWSAFAFRRGALAAGPLAGAKKFAPAAAQWWGAIWPALEAAPLDPLVRQEQTWLVCQLRRREAERAQFLPHVDGMSEDALAARISAATAPA